jgi:hypothetical protein
MKLLIFTSTACIERFPSLHRAMQAMLSVVINTLGKQFWRKEAMTLFRQLKSGKKSNAV